MDEEIKKEIDQAVAEQAENNEFGAPLAIPAHNHDNVNSEAILYSDLEEIQKFIIVRIVKNDTVTTTGTSVGGDFVMPFEGYITSVGATVDTAGTTNTTDVDINKNGSTILSTVITIDSTEKTSRTASTPYKFVNDSPPTFLEGDIITFDIDAVHSTPATGLSVFMTIVHNPQQTYANI